MNHMHAIVSTVLLALAVVATAAPVRQVREGPPECWLFSYATSRYVKLSPDGNVTADGQREEDTAIYVETISGTNPQQIRIESAQSTSENVRFLIFEDGAFKGGSPLNGNEVFEKVPVSPPIYALRVVNPRGGLGSGSGSGESGVEVGVDYYFGFSKETSEAGLYESIDSETKFVFVTNHE